MEVEMGPKEMGTRSFVAVELEEAEAGVVEGGCDGAGGCEPCGESAPKFGGGLRAGGGAAERG